MHNNREELIKKYKEEWFQMFACLKDYPLHKWEDAWEEAEIAYEDGLIAVGQMQQFAYSSCK